jgi:broad specificity phosphatase PhoE
LAGAGQRHSRSVVGTQAAQIVAARLGLPAAAELGDLRELDVGALDGRGDAGATPGRGLPALPACAEVLVAWRAGRVRAGFPGGEGSGGLCMRLRRAVAVVAGGSSGGRPLVVARGAGLRAALPGFAGGPGPGAGLPAGALAGLPASARHRPRPAVRLLNWRD